MDKKIFFFDLDGTLLNDEKKITPRTMEALKAFTAEGNHFAINTGRAIDSAQMVQRELGLFFPGSYLVGFNGAQIYDCDKGEIVYRAKISFDLVKTVFELAAKRGIHVHTYSDHHIISPDDGEELEFYRRVIKTQPIITDDVISQLPVEPSKCIAIELHDLDRLEEFRKELNAIAGDRLQLMYSHPYYLEIFPPEAGKGAAVKRLCDMLGIPVSNSLAAGDEQNDISMIKAAGTGIAMLNATDQVKSIADAVTENDHNHDGLVPFLTGDWLHDEYLH